MSRIRENPDRLFEVFIEVGKTSNPGEDPFILQKYPLDFNDEEVLKNVPKFAFPCDTERTTVDHFTFTMTDLDSKFRFGFCRHATGAQTCFCVVSFLPWCEVFFNLLNLLAEIMNRSDDNDVTLMLRAAYVQEVPSSGLPVTIVAGQEMFSFKAPDASKLPSIPTSRNLLEYYNAIDTDNMMFIFASMLHERRIIVTSKKLSRLTAVIHAATALLYPMFWQFLFIPVLPEHLIDYLTAPMPFVIGVHTKLMEKTEKLELGDAVIVDADKNTVASEYDDFDELPDDMASYLKKNLKAEKVKNAMQTSPDIISKTFMMSLVKLIGGYRDALKFNEGETITFCPEAFLRSRPAPMQPFLENMLHLQTFQQFINERLDMLNNGHGFSDVFEQECLVHADKLNSQTRYNEWLSKMKKQGKKVSRGGKDVWADFKVKVKMQGKKAYSKARTKMNDLKKPPRPGATSPMSPNAPKILVEHPASERSSRYMSHVGHEKRGCVDDNDVMVYTRVSCNLMGDPDIQHALFKSASAEHLPKNKILQTSHSTDTLTSSSDGDLDPQDAAYYNTEPGNHDNNSGGIEYTNLLDDDDSGIVVQTNSQTSLDKTRPDMIDTSSDSGVNSTDKHYPPPRPAPRRSTGPAPAVIEDRLIGSRNVVRERPSPAPRRLSFEKKTLVAMPSGPGPGGDNQQTGQDDSLIDLDTISSHGDSFTLSTEFEKMDPAGDYVLIREPMSANTNAFTHTETIEHSISSKRSSISRTPAIKLGQNETPRRPSVRRDQAAVSAKGDADMLDFDPLSNSFNQSSSSAFSQSSSFSQSGMTYGTSPIISGNDQTKTPGVAVQSSTSDSLLKDWDIGNLASLTNTGKPPVPQPGYLYGHPTPPPRQPITNNMAQPKFYTPQPNRQSAGVGLGSLGSKNSAMGGGNSSHLGFKNPLVQLDTSTPQVPPRPHRTSPASNSKLTQSGTSTSSSRAQSTTVNKADDPFADLLNLNQSSTQKQTNQSSSSWETFN